ncbi:HET-domain-containing protein [Patellaria atrata CBS 101060]|uniref:HET-domain-containing protein n=1 Tax=Patellaria atrata CBS 101060 TaxID=1346257 RepID=A0A9P4S6M5_9PEZI|nr:HET-domain-containing protein [Patellaria atrata CBS 101060]
MERSTRNGSSSYARIAWNCDEAKVRLYKEQLAVEVEHGSRFVYSPLDVSKREIRLIQLLPKHANDEDGTLHCLMNRISIGGDLAYAALSYVWGKPDLTHKVWLMNSPFYITENLASALHHLQEDDKTLSLWVDAVCINQADEVEKSAQVQLMRFIYERAEMVISWLGPEADESNLAMMDLRAVGEALSGEGVMVAINGDVNDRAEFLNNSWEQVLAKHINGSGEFNPITLEPIFSLARRPYWERCWVLQEIVLGREIIIVCGNLDLPLSNFERVIWALKEYARLQSPYSDAHLTELKSWIGRSLNVHPHIMLSVIAQLADGKQPLRNLLGTTCVGTSTYSGLKATNPRDHIYALLGISSDLKLDTIEPNYTRSTELVYLDFAYFMNLKDFGLFSYCQFPKNFENLPSWVPDWSMRLIRPISRLSKFDASGGGLCEILESSGKGLNQILYPKGSILDYVAEVTDIWKDDGEDSINRATAWFMEVERLSRLNADIWESDEERLEAVWKVPIADTEWSGVLEQEAYHATETMYQSYNALRGLNQAPLERMWNVTSDRRVFATSQGLLCLGPQNIEENDQIVIFLGADVPHAIRFYNDGRYDLVGEVYVWDYMDGKWFEEEREIEEFTLT